MDFLKTQNLAAKYVEKLYNTTIRHYLFYHNFAHTQRVVNYAMEIAANYNLSAKERTVIYIAAWFHDTGHMFSTIEGHEEESVKIMKRFFLKEEICRLVFFQNGTFIELKNGQ